MSLEAKLKRVDKETRTHLTKLAKQPFEDYFNGASFKRAPLAASLGATIFSYARVTKVKPGRNKDVVSIELGIEKYPTEAHVWDERDPRLRIRTFEGSNRAVTLKVNSSRMYGSYVSGKYKEEISFSPDVVEYFSNLNVGDRLIVGIKSPFLGRAEKSLDYVLRSESDYLVRLVEISDAPKIPRIKPKKVEPGISRVVERLQSEGYNVPEMNLNLIMGPKEIRALYVQTLLPQFHRNHMWFRDNKTYTCGNALTTKGLVLGYIESLKNPEVEKQPLISAISSL